MTKRIGGKGANAWNLYNRASQRQRQGEDIIILAIGEPDFKTPAPITEAAIASLHAGDTHYSDIAGDPELRALIAHEHTQQTQQPISADQVVVVAGAQCGLYCAAQCVLDVGDEVIIPEPMYVTYEAVMGAAGAKIVSVPARAENRFHVVPAEIQAAITRKTKAVMINFPNNPTGAVLTQAEMEAIAQICIENDLWLLSDEVYAPLTFDAPHVSPCAFPGMAERTITINSLSKSYAMTGWRMGWVIGPPALAEHVGRLALCMLYGSPQFIQNAAKAALQNPLPEQKIMKEAYERRRDLVHQRLSQTPLLDCHLPEGGMFVMVDVRQTGLGGYDYAEMLLEQFNVAVLPTDAFGPSGEGHIRVNLGTADELLETACERMIACADSIQKMKP